MHSNTTTNQTSVTTLWDNSKPAAVAVGKYLGNVLRALGTKNHGALAACTLEPVGVVALNFVVARDDTVLPQYFLEVRNIIGRYASEVLTASGNRAAPEESRDGTMTALLWIENATNSYRDSQGSSPDCHGRHCICRRYVTGRFYSKA